MLEDSQVWGWARPGKAVLLRDAREAHREVASGHTGSVALEQMIVARKLRDEPGRNWKPGKEKSGG